MSEADTTPPAGSDPLVSALGAQTGAIRCLADLGGATARDVASIDGSVARIEKAIAALEKQVRGAVSGFSDQHGNREAAELAAADARRKAQGTLDLILGQVQTLSGRLGALEARQTGAEKREEGLRGDVAELRGAVVALEARLSPPDDEPGSNGTNGAGHA